MNQRDWISALFESVDAKDTAKFLSFLTEDACFRFGSNSVLEGKNQIKAGVDRFFASIKKSEHRILNTWEAGDDAICRGEVTYTRLDDSRITLPFANIFKMKGRQIWEYLIYIDIAPLYAPAA